MLSFPKTILRVRWLVVLFLGLGTLPVYLWAYSMAGRSEIPTILVGDKLLVSTAAYKLSLPFTNVTILNFSTPTRGEMVQLRFPMREFVGFKRVLGLPGEVIEVREGRVIVNGSLLPVTPLSVADFSWLSKDNRLGSFVGIEQDHFVTFTPGLKANRDCPPISLHARQYFLLGDNRDDSWDSRYFGPVSAERIMGKVIAVFPNRIRANR